jgi:hypothetical protein
MTFRVRTAGTAVRCALLLVASVLTTWTATSIMAAPASAAPVVCQKSYTDLKPSEIQAGAADTSIDMTVPDDYEVADVDVQVDITHPNDGEVDLTIGRGSLQYLTNSNGGTGDDFADTIFDDEAAGPSPSGPLRLRVATGRPTRSRASTESPPRGPGRSWPRTRAPVRAR